MPPQRRHSPSGRATASSTSGQRNRPRKLDLQLRHFLLIAVSPLAAGASWFVVGLLAARFISTSFASLAAFSAAWVSLYPLSRLNRAVPAWSHWVRGAFVLVVFWLLIVFSR